LLIEKNQLMTRLLELEKNVRTEVESQLSEAKAMLVSATRAQAFSSVALQVAHDIRSPLAALDLIQKEFQKEGKSDAKADWSLIQALLPLATARVKSIAENVLNASRSCVASKVDLRKALEDLILEKRVEHSGKGVKIELRYVGKSDEGTLVKIQDVDGLTRTCSNLLNNAIEASQERFPEGPSTVAVRLSLGQASALIEILDSGLGLPAQLLYALETGDFSQVKSSKVDGHGIGLKTAYHWASQNGGRLLATPQTAGQGTTLKLEVARLA
jgi:signal transduction histidine kinase